MRRIFQAPPAILQCSVAFHRRAQLGLFYFLLSFLFVLAPATGQVSSTLLPRLLEFHHRSIFRFVIQFCSLHVPPFSFILFVPFYIVVSPGGRCPAIGRGSLMSRLRLAGHVPVFFCHRRRRAQCNQRGPLLGTIDRCNRA